METLIVKKFDYYQYTVPIITKTEWKLHELVSKSKIPKWYTSIRSS